MNNLKHELLKYTKWLREHGHLQTAPFPPLVVQYLASNPKEPEAVHGHEVEEEVCENPEWYKDHNGLERCSKCFEFRVHHS